jgi:hypothetical protein
MQQVTKGLVLLVAVAIDVISKSRFGFERAARFAGWIKGLFLKKPVKDRTIES